MSTVQYHLVSVPDGALPSFISRECDWIGTGETIRELGLRNILCHALHPVATTSLAETDFTWEYRNIWGGWYYFNASRVDAKLFYFQLPEGRYGRFISARFEQLASVRLYGLPHKAVTQKVCWGYPGLIADTGSCCVENVLLFQDRTFETKMEAVRDAAHPALVNYDRFFNEVVGDG